MRALASTRRFPPGPQNCGVVVGGAGSVLSCGMCGGGLVGGSVGGWLWNLTLLLLLLLSNPGGLDISVRVCPSVFSLLSYSQHGKTMCPDGAISPWTQSVPGGRADIRS